MNVSSSAWKNSVNASIGGEGMHLNFCTLKSLNGKRTQLKIRCATFNANLCTKIISCYSPSNVRDELDITTFYNGLSSLAQHIPQYNILIISGDMNF